MGHWPPGRHLDAWWPALTVHATRPAALRAVAEQAIDGDDPEWDDPA
ncbi:MAG: hypothetical protein ACM32E_28645 [Gemmatimonadota bacterium]